MKSNLSIMKNTALAILTALAPTLSLADAVDAQINAHNGFTVVNPTYQGHPFLAGSDTGGYKDARPFSEQLIESSDGVCKLLGYAKATSFSYGEASENLWTQEDGKLVLNYYRRLGGHAWVYIPYYFTSLVCTNNSVTELLNNVTSSAQMSENGERIHEAITAEAQLKPENEGTSAASSESTTADASAR